MTNLKLSLIVDVLMLSALALVFISTQIRGWREVHSTAGWIFLGLVVLHLILHRFYIKNFFRILSQK